MIIGPLERRFGEQLNVIQDRFRAQVLRWRGARIDGRARVASGCVVRRPWRLIIGERSQLEHNVYLKAVTDSARIELGRGVFVGCNSEFDISEILQIGDNVLIAPGCFITDHNHRRAGVATIASQGCESQAVRIEDDVWLGAHVIILPGITIGRGAIVAAGAVVTEDVEAMSIVAGVPARKVSSRIRRATDQAIG